MSRCANAEASKAVGSIYFFHIHEYALWRWKFSPKEISPKDSLSNGIFAEQKFRRTEFSPSIFSPNEISAESFHKVEFIGWT